MLGCPLVRNPVRFAQLVVALTGGLAGVAAATLVDGDAARGGLVGLGALCFVLAALLPLLTGRLKVGGLEGELREDLAETLTEAGSREGVEPEKMDRLVRSVDQVLQRLSSQPPPMAGPAGKAGEVMVCAKCGVIARLEPPPPQRITRMTPADSLIYPSCRACGSMQFKLPE